MKLSDSAGRRQMLQNHFEVIDVNVTRMYDNKGNCTLIDTEDIDLLKPYYWYKNVNGYWSNSPRKNVKRMYLHRFVKGLPEGKQLDHKKGNLDDNRKQELRECTNQQNSCNQKPYGKTGHKNVYLHSRGTHYFVSVDKKYFGLFDDFEIACKVADEAERRLHREFSFSRR